MFLRLFVLVCLSLTSLAACQSPAPEREVRRFTGQFTPPPKAPPDSSAQADQQARSAYEVVPTYRIGVDDLLLVSVWGNDQLTVKVPVRPDGRISVPLVGDVVAGGKTPEEVARHLEDQLDDYVRDPKISVILVELRSHTFVSRVRVTGAVRTPMSVPWRQGMTVLDLVLLAGGLNDFASPGRARLYRKGGDQARQPVVRDIDLDDILYSGQLETNHELLPGDVLTVPERLF